MFKENEKIKALREKEQADKVLEKILADEQHEKQKQAAVELKRKRDERKYQLMCESYSVNKSAGYRFIAMLEWIQSHPGRVIVTVNARGVPSHTVVSMPELIKRFRLEQLIATLDKMDLSGLTLNEYLKIIDVWD